VTVWLNLALGLINVINFVLTKLDEAQKRKVWEEALKTELGRIQESEIQKALAARLAVDVSPERLRDPSSDSTT
jgi:hypothetical protein